MEPKNGRKSPMSMAADAATLPRSAAQFLVRRAERQTGSRMAAYASVARAVGTTSDWLRKFIKGDEAKEPGWTVGWNLIAHCNVVLCTRVEQEIEMERALIESLKRQIDAATSSVTQMVESSQRETAASEGGFR